MPPEGAGAKVEDRPAMTNGTALVTGASRGIGKAVAHHLAGKGFDLVLLSRGEADLATLAADLADRYDVEASYVPVDLADADAVRAELPPVLRRVGGLRVLVNAAGIIRRGTAGLAVADFERLLATNVVAVHALCALCADSLAAAAPAHVFTLSSISAVDGSAPFGGYAASKAAVLAYSRSLGRELMGRNVKVTAICPDLVDTGMGRAVGGAARPMLLPRDICAAIDFVMALSPNAAVEQIAIRCADAVETQGAMEMASVRP